MHTHYLNRITALKIIDSCIGPFFTKIASLFHHPKREQFDRPKSILFIRPGGIGDATLLISVIIALKRSNLDSIIAVLAEERNAATFKLCPEINKVFIYDRPRDLWAALHEKYDVVIDTEQWHRLSAVAARMTRAPMLIGYATNEERKKLFTHPIPYFHDDYELNSFLNLLAPITGNVTVDTEKPFLAIPETVMDKVRPLLQLLSGKKIVAIFPGGSIKERRWGSDRFHDVARRLAAHGYGIVVVGGKEDIADANEIASRISNVVNLCGKLSLVETAAVLNQTSLLITGDSGIMHIAYGLGTPTVSLFGPGIEKKWAPRGKHHVTINKNLDCSPCTKFGYTPKCKKNAECMRLITVEEVFEKAIELLER